MSKSIAIICEYTLFPERIGGMDRFFVAYDKALKKEGFTVDWFFKDTKLFNFYKELTIYDAKNTSIETYFLNYCKSNNIKYDIVITHFLQPVSPFFKVIKKIMNPYIINVDHNPRPLEGFALLKRFKNKIKGILYGKYVNKLIGVSDYTTNYILKDFGFHLKNKTKTIYNGIDTKTCSKQNLNRLKKPIKFIVVSHLRESKGIQDLLKAIHKLDKNSKEKISVDIYGEGSYKDTLTKLQKKYLLEKTVHFKGSTSRINNLLSNYHYLIQPTYMECFSLSILESLASNVPVITTTVGGNIEIISDGKNGFIFKPKDIDALALIIREIVSEEISILNSVNLQIEKDYTLDIMVANHLKLVECT